MAVSYKKLWKLLIDKEMMKKDLRAMTGVSTTTMSRLSKDENVSTEILSKICSALNCDVGDIMEFVPDKKEPYFYYRRSKLLYRPYFLPLSCHHPFTAPIIIPPTTYFCILKYTIRIGNVARIKKANARFRSEVYSLK